MGWRFPWVSSFESDFNYDYQVAFTREEVARGRAFYNFQESDIVIEDIAGLSVFVKDGAGDVFHTYSTYARNLDPINCACQLLDLAPRGRDEDGREWPMAWLRRHDGYDICASCRQSQIEL
jgi:predicted dithiol-disulfide oxidoreductase (DUF899 family)